MQPEIQAIQYVGNFTAVAFKILIECLEKNGALRPGQIRMALRGTIAHPQAERDRLDYQLLADLLKRLDDSVESPQ
jgi:hypothetical protein